MMVVAIILLAGLIAITASGLRLLKVVYRIFALLYEVVCQLHLGLRLPDKYFVSIKADHDPDDATGFYDVEVVKRIYNPHVQGFLFINEAYCPATLIRIEDFEYPAYARSNYKYLVSGRVFEKCCSNKTEMMLEDVRRHKLFDIYATKKSQFEMLKSIPQGITFIRDQEVEIECYKDKADEPNKSNIPYFVTHIEQMTYESIRESAPEYFINEESNSARRLLAALKT